MKVSFSSANKLITECCDSIADAYASKLELKGAIEYALNLLIKDNLVTTEIPSTITVSMIKIEEKIYRLTVKMSSDYIFVSDEELIHINEVDKENVLNKGKENSSENYEQSVKLRDNYAIVPFKAKLKVITLA
ncbi:hypothetical protein M0802_014854 [Mischocyttarus mexicanus]|nr:hypothetical protein M0802_014854 [Mischocyttarus mexicanus]